MIVYTRTGRGAATDRLALLLLVLEARETGRVRLCGGSVDTKRGRAAATLARLMGCTPAAAAGILGRLESRELVFRVRLETASGLANRSRLLVPTVAAAHGCSGADVDGEDRAEVLESVFSERGVAAGRSETSQPEEDPQVNSAPVADEADVADPGVAAALHTDHPSPATPRSSLSLSGGFSGEGRGGFGNLPDRACEREDQAVGGDAAARLTLVDGEGGPLRGEQPKGSPVVESEKGSCGPVAGRSARVLEGEGQGRQQRGRVALPSLDLRAVLAPVKLVWIRLERPAARRLVETRARTELAQVVGFAGPTDAPQILADRLARRLECQMLLGGPITDPAGWLIGRGLPQIRLCAEPRCDEGTLLDSGGDCPRCEDRQVNSRATRRTVAAAVDAAMPGASETERRAATDRQLHETVTARAWAKAYEWEQHRARKAEAKAARAEAAAAQPEDDAPAVSLAAVVLPVPRPAAAALAPEPEVAIVDDQELVLDDLTPDQVRHWRVRAMRDDQVLFDHIDRYGEPSARRLFSNRLVEQAQRLSGLGHLNVGYFPWGQS
ncbi:hypothetical protein [Streptomyces globisporus]